MEIENEKLRSGGHAIREWIRQAGKEIISTKDEDVFSSVELANRIAIIHPRYEQTPGRIANFIRWMADMEYAHHEIINGRRVMMYRFKGSKN